MKKIIISVFVVLIIGLVCRDQIFNDEEMQITSQENVSGEASVKDFYRLLSEKNYSDAIPLYKGSYDVLRNWNPETDPNDFLTLWKQGCEMNGLNCLKVRAITGKTEKPVEGEYESLYEFTVQYQKQDGSMFEIGPCCGESDAGERIKDFKVLAGKKGNKYFILTQPPYTP